MVSWVVLFSARKKQREWGRECKALERESYSCAADLWETVNGTIHSGALVRQCRFGKMNLRRHIPPRFRNEKSFCRVTESTNRRENCQSLDLGLYRRGLPKPVTRAVPVKSLWKQKVTSENGHALLPYIRIIWIWILGGRECFPEELPVAMARS